MVPGNQAVVVRLVWTDSPADSGWFGLIALDKRSTPPIPLVGDGSWSAAGERGSFWSSSFNEIAKRYDWLANVGWNPPPDDAEPRPYPMCALAVPAARAGTGSACWSVLDVDEKPPTRAKVSRWRRPRLKVWSPPLERPARTRSSRP